MMNQREIEKELNLVNASKSSRLLARVTMIAIISTTLAHIVHYVYLNMENQDLSKRVVYIDSNGMTGSGEVKSMEDKEVVLIQVKAAIRYAVPYLYSFNSANYDQQIEKGLHLFGKCGREIHTGYINDRLREKIFNNNLEVLCDIKEVKIMDDGKAIVTFEQTVVNGQAKQARTLTAEMSLSQTKVSELNPFGYLIENWVIINESR